MTQHDLSGGLTTEYKTHILKLTSGSHHIITCTLLIVPVANLYKATISSLLDLVHTVPLQYETLSITTVKPVCDSRSYLIVIATTP